MTGNIDLTLRGRMLWIAAAMAIGTLSQYCINYGLCAAPLG